MGKFLKVLAVMVLLIPAFAFAEIKSADVAKVDELLKTGKYTVVDVRTQGEFASGYIKGAVNVDFYNNFEEVAPKILTNKNKPYILYCRSGRRSVHAAQILEKLGYTNVTNMEGGILVWQNAGKPVVK